jgi:hypothetical protein
LSCLARRLASAGWWGGGGGAGSNAPGTPLSDAQLDDHSDLNSNENRLI